VVVTKEGRKKKLWRQTKGSSTTDENREADRNVKTLIRRAKRGFEKKLADDKSGSVRQFFAYVRKKTKSRPTIGPLKKDGKLVAEDLEMAGVLNEFFILVFTHEDIRSIPEPEDMDREEDLDNIHITEWKVWKKIRKLRATAAAGPDEIRPRILQELEELAGGLALVFQRSVLTGVVPDD